MKEKILITAITFPLAFASCGKKEAVEEKKPAVEVVEKKEPAPGLAEEVADEEPLSDGLADEAPNVEEPIEAQ